MNVEALGNIDDASDFEHPVCNRTVTAFKMKLTSIYIKYLVTFKVSTLNKVVFANFDDHCP